MASLLLDHGADPSAANHSTGWTAAMQAAQMGDLETVKLLAKRGADFAALSDLTLALNINQNHPAAAAFIDAVVRWPPIRIAVACRAPTDLGAMLRRGLVDTIGHHSRAELIATATSPAELWPGQPAPCPATASGGHGQVVAVEPPAPPRQLSGGGLCRAADGGAANLPG